MRFGIFSAPLHPCGRNPTLYLERDLQLVRWLDELGYDEAWIGEHHSGGTEIIGSPEVFIAAAAQHTRNIKLGTGVVSVPYHHPLMVAERMVLLDHLTRGRTMFGVGPGALPADAYMLGFDPTEARPRMEEGLEAIMALLTSDEPVTRKTDWFELREARMNLRPYTHPCFELAIATTVSPNGPRNAGRFGGGLLSLSCSTETGFEKLREQWEIWDFMAAEHGHAADRARWRMVAPVHLAETREQARRDIEYGIADWVDYFQTVVAIPAAPDTDDLDEYVDWMIDSGFAVIGTPDDAAGLIRRLLDQSGGFGCFLVMAHDWADRRATRLSYELLAGEVFPRFQGSAERAAASHAWALEKAPDFMPRQMLAGQQARERHAADMSERKARENDD